MTKEEIKLKLKEIDDKITVLYSSIWPEIEILQRERITIQDKCDHTDWFWNWDNYKECSFCRLVEYPYE